MPEMRTDKNKDRYFRGDEVGAKNETAAVAPPSAISAPATAVPLSDSNHPPQ
jgi:hypothetical protein